MYVRIANKSEGVNRLYLEKLGISTKRDNDDTIGQFGSGAKFAPIAAMRKGWEWITVGSDDIGDYQMKYGYRETQGINEVFFDYGDVVKDSSYTLEAGSLSWEDDFQIIREALANAIDAHVEFGAEWEWSIVSHVEHVPGEFAVYITDEETGQPPVELLDILHNIDSWFSIDRVSLAKNRQGEIYRRGEDDGVVKVFHRGVRVHEIVTGDFKYTFDYELDKVALNEERRIRDSYGVGQKIADLLSLLDDDDYGVVRILLERPDETVEFETISRHQTQYNNWNPVWAEQWKKVHGQKAIPISGYVDHFVYERLRHKGYKPVITSDSLVKALQISGIPDFVTILGEGYDIETIELDDIGQKIFDSAVKLCNEAGFEINPKEFKFFDDDEMSIAGKAAGGIRYINRQILTWGNTAEIIGTIIHENDHCVSGICDGDENFRGLADTHIGNLVLKLNKGGGS